MSDIVSINRNRAETTSLKVAVKFKKRHERVLDAIKNLDCSDEFAKHNFVFCYYDDRGRNLPMYKMTRDGFTFLAMGFTGKKAAKFKEDYIQAFNEMERFILQQQNLSWKQLRLDGKHTRHELTDEIQQFVEYASSQGSKSADRYYMVISKETNKALFLLKSKAPKDFRNMLSQMQLSFLQTAEFVARNGLREGMEKELFYKDIYKLAIGKVRRFAESVDRVPVLPAA